MCYCNDFWLGPWDGSHNVEWFPSLWLFKVQQKVTGKFEKCKFPQSDTANEMDSKKKALCNIWHLGKLKYVLYLFF